MSEKRIAGVRVGSLMALEGIREWACNAAWHLNKDQQEARTGSPATNNTANHEEIESALVGKKQDVHRLGTWEKHDPRNQARE